MKTLKTFILFLLAFTSLQAQETCEIRFTQPMQAFGEQGTFWDQGDTIYWYVYSDTYFQDIKAAFVRADELTNLTFIQTTDVNRSDIRVGTKLGDGSWSYVGRDNRNIPKNWRTANIGWADNKGTILHEIVGHALGLLHCHQNAAIEIDWIKENVIKDLGGPPNNWDIGTIEHNLFDKLPLSRIQTNGFDPQSFMCYPLKRSWYTNDFVITGSDDLTYSDESFLRELYPPIEDPVVIDKTDCKKELLRGLYVSDKRLRCKPVKSQLQYLAKELNIDQSGTNKILRKRIIDALN